MSGGGDAGASASPTRIGRVLLTIVLACAGGYAVLVLLLFLFQARLVYFPQVGREVTTTPLAAGLVYEDVWLAAGKDERLHGWYVAHPQPRGIALILHGNAGTIAHRIEWLRMFHGFGYASFIIDYRGYGRSAGSPSEEGTYADADAAWNYLTQARGWTAADIVVVGESLGGPVAARLAARGKPRALILQSTFTSLPDVAAQVYPFLPVRWISRFRYDTRASLSDVSAPVLVAHSRGDELIAFDHGRALYEAVRGPKQFVELHGGHNDAALFSRGDTVQVLGTFLDAARMR